PSWIDLAEIRVNTTESRFAACLNRLLQQNRPVGEVQTGSPVVRFVGQSGSGSSGRTRRD
ncbi:hypothetical protein, partial [Bradyrhizobium sp. WSM2254]|uniref:hypothetical protein n=1 Tax=Bradyrhizobium sp. WSM2254 TaxID=1188263 RepID=UPI001AEBC691